MTRAEVRLDQREVGGSWRKRRAARLRTALRLVMRVPAGWLSRLRYPVHCWLAYSRPKFSGPVTWLDTELANLTPSRRQQRPKLLMAFGMIEIAV